MEDISPQIFPTSRVDLVDKNKNIVVVIIIIIIDKVVRERGGIWITNMWHHKNIIIILKKKKVITIELFVVLRFLVLRGQYAKAI